MEDGKQEVMEVISLYKMEENLPNISSPLQRWALESMVLNRNYNRQISIYYFRGPLCILKQRFKIYKVNAIEFLHLTIYIKWSPLNVSD